MSVWLGYEAPQLCVDLPDRELATAVRELFSGYLRDADGGVEVRADPPPVRIRVRGARNGYRIEGEAELLNGLKAVTTATRMEALVRVEAAVARGLLSLRPEVAHVHGAGSVLGGGGVLALGDSGAGKSTLAFHWSMSGRPLLGDDVVLLDAEGRIHPFRRVVKVPSDRVVERGLDPRETLYWSDGSPEAWFDPRRAGGWARRPVRPSVIALLGRTSGGGARLEDVDPAEALAEILAGVLPTGASQAESIDPIRSMLLRARVVRVSYENSRGAAELLERLVGSVEGRLAAGNGVERP